MNTPFTLRLISWPGLGTSLALAVLWLGLSEIRGAQSSFGNVDMPLGGASFEPPWPAVEWGIQPVEAGREDMDSPVGKVSIPSLRSEAQPVVLSLRSAKGDVALNFNANRDLGLGPVVSVCAPAAGEIEMSGPTGRAIGRMRLGNVTFNQAADSLNVWKTGVAKDGDLSRQFQTEAITANVVQASAFSGWAVVALAALAVMIAMAIGYYENDRDDRHRRRSSRKSRRRHPRAS